MRKFKEVKAYECPDCRHLTTDIEEAIEHARLPRNDLPRGLVFKLKLKRSQVYMVITGTSYVDDTHSVEHEKVILNESCREHVLSKEQDFKDEWSSSIRRCLCQGSYNLLTPDEFEQFKRDYRIPIETLTEIGLNLVRTSPEVEELVAGVGRT
jgi:hypothetical protein